MTERSREFLQQQFQDGERPSGADFGDLIDSSLNKADDGLDVDAQSNLVLSGGLALGNSNRQTAGTLRFNAGSVQFHNGTEFVDLSAGGDGESVFAPAGQAGEVAYAGGNVGIGPFPQGPPTSRLHVALAGNGNEQERVRFGAVTLSNGSGGNLINDACFYQQDHSDRQTMALRQRASGEVFLNAPTNQTVRLTQNGNQTRLAVAANTGQVIIGRSTPVTSQNFVFQVSGNAFKTDGGSAWNVASDARVKEDVRDLDAGLEQLLQVRPVRFRFNGKASTQAGAPGVGIIGQEIERVFPEMVQRVPARLEEGADEVDLRVYDSSALTYVLVNAVKELANRVAELETALAGKEPADEDDR